MGNGAIEMKLKENDNDDDDEIRNEMYTMADVWTSIKPKRRARPQRPTTRKMVLLLRAPSKNDNDRLYVDIPIVEINASYLQATNNEKQSTFENCIQKETEKQLVD